MRGAQAARGIRRAPGCEASGRCALIERMGTSNWQVLELGEMNHAFQRCETCMPDEYASIGHVMAPEVIAAVTAWIASVTRG
jgi:hypothetical protein